MTVVVATDPMVVVSVNKEQGRLVVVKIPPTVVIPAVRGYGSYSLASLWQLGEIEKQEGVALRESLAELLGVPVPWYLAPVASPASAEAADIVRQTFSWKSFLARLRGDYRTNLPWRELTAFIKVVWTTPADRLATLDLGKSPALVVQEMPDGSRVTTLDSERLDDIIANLWEIESVRQEKVTVAVFNTTDKPTLAERAARRLTRLGILVVVVANDQPTVDRCVLSGKDQALASKTASIINFLFNCERQRESGEMRTDLEVRLGKAYQASL